MRNRIKNKIFFNKNLFKKISRLSRDIFYFAETSVLLNRELYLLESTGRPRVRLPWIEVALQPGCGGAAAAVTLCVFAKICFPDPLMGGVVAGPVAGAGRYRRLPVEFCGGKLCKGLGGSIFLLSLVNN